MLKIAYLVFTCKDRCRCSRKRSTFAKICQAIGNYLEAGSAPGFAIRCSVQVSPAAHDAAEIQIIASCSPWFSYRRRIVLPPSTGGSTG